MFTQEIIDQIKNHYPKSAEVDVRENQITVTITEYNSDSIDEVNILFVPNAKIQLSTYAYAEASFCERYGEVKELNISIVYVPVPA